MTTVTISESPITVAATEEVVTVSVSSQEVSVSVTEGASVDHDHDDDYEPVLGNPGTDGYVLSSTAAGVRSWIELMSGGGVEFPWQPDSDGVHSILQNAAGTNDVLAMDTLALNLILDATGGLRPDADTTSWPLVQDASGNQMVVMDTVNKYLTIEPSGSKLEYRFARATLGDLYRGFQIFHTEEDKTGAYFTAVSDADSPYGHSLAQMSFVSAPTTPNTTGINVYVQANSANDVGEGVIGSSQKIPIYLVSQAKRMLKLDYPNRLIELSFGGGAKLSINDTTNTTTIATNNLILSGSLPTSDPAVAGAVWSDGGTLKISAG